MKNQKDYSQFLELVHSSSKAALLAELLDLFLTIDEKESLARRYLTVKYLLEAKHPQREISELTGISISQITRGSNFLKTISPDLSKFLEGAFQNAGGA